jgi:hypothetical protein
MIFRTHMCHFHSYSLKESGLNPKELGMPRDKNKDLHGEPTYTYLRTCMQCIDIMHHDVHKQCIGICIIMHCRVGKKHWGYSKTSIPRYPGELFTSCNISTLARKTRKSETFPQFMPCIAIAATCMEPAYTSMRICCHRRHFIILYKKLFLNFYLYLFLELLINIFFRTKCEIFEDFKN